MKKKYKKIDGNSNPVLRLMTRETLNQLSDRFVGNLLFIYTALLAILIQQE